MGKYLIWILLGIIAVVIFILAFNYVKKEARPLVASPAELERLEIGKLDPSDLVSVGLDDQLYHRPDCPEIKGSTESMTLRTAKEEGFKPCPICLGNGGS